MARLRFAWIAGGLVLVALAATPSLLLAYAFDAVVTVFPEPSEAKPGQRQPDRIRLNPSVYCSNQGEFAARVTMNWPIPFSFFQCWGLMEKGTQNLTSIHFRNQCRTVDPLHRMPDRVMSAHTVSCTTADVDGVDLDMVVCCPPGPDAQAAVGIPAQQRPAKPPRELVKYCPEPGQYPIRMTWQRSGTYPESLCPELKKAAVEDLTSDHYQSRCRALDGAQRYKGRVSSAHVLSCMESVGGSGGDNREFAAEVVACCVSE
jgi:hypothetical protein